MANAVTVEGANPTVLDIADCLKCAAELPADWHAMPIEMAGAEYRYRLCRLCVDAYYAGSEDDVARWKAEFWARLERISEDMVRNAHAMLSEQQETAQ